MSDNIAAEKDGRLLADIESRIRRCALDLCDEWESLDVDSADFRAALRMQSAIQAVSATLNAIDTRTPDLLFAGAPHLTIEAFVVRPAWRAHFSDADVSMAMSRLVEHESAFERDSIEGLVRGDATILWNEGIPVAYAGGFDLTTPADICEQIRNASINLAEKGRVSAPLGYRLHLTACERCASLCEHLRLVFDTIDRREFSRLRQLLRTLLCCVEIWRENAPPYNSKIATATAWRAIVLANTLAESLELDEAISAWLQAAECHGNDALTQFMHSLDGDELSAFRLLECVNTAFEGLWREHVCSQTGVHLPSWGDLSSVPGVVTAVPCPTWEAIADLIGNPPEVPIVTGVEEFFVSGFLEIAVKAANIIPREALGGSSLRPNANEIKSLDEVAEDLIRDSHVPASVRDDLENRIGAAIFNSLSPEARSCAVGAEQLLQLIGLEDYDAAVWKLAKAFEFQVQSRVHRPFFNQMIERGVMHYPDSGPYLIRKGHMQPVTLGQTRTFLATSDDLRQFVTKQELSIPRILSAIDIILETRNQATHAVGFPRERALGIRDQWLAWCGVPGGVFSVFVPTPTP